MRLLATQKKPGKQGKKAVALFIKIAKADLEWSASFVGLSLSSLYQGQFANQQLFTNVFAVMNGCAMRFRNKSFRAHVFSFLEDRGGLLS